MIGVWMGRTQCLGRFSCTSTRSTFTCRGSKWRDELTRIAVPLSTLREKLGGEEGVVTDEFGESHPISIVEWTGHDPATRLLIWFTYQQRNAPEGFRESVYPPDVPERAHPSVVARHGDAAQAGRPSGSSDCPR
jgi:hypothetical protein